LSIYVHLFFFSSRRRHTRFSRDWSSDVCSSDLVRRQVPVGDTVTVAELAQRMAVKATEVIKALMSLGVMATINQSIDQDTAVLEIGRASCRERVEAAGAIVAVEKRQREARSRVR